MTGRKKLEEYLRAEYGRLVPRQEMRDLAKRERARGRLAVVTQVMAMMNLPTPQRKAKGTSDGR